MPSFDDFPAELGEEIVSFCALPGGRNDLRSLRLVSHYCHDLATPILFSALNLIFEYHDSQNPQTLRSQEIIQALASGTTRVYERTVRLRFKPGLISNWRYDYSKGVKVYITSNAMAENLYAAVLSLKNLKDVYWRHHVSSNHSNDIANSFIRALGANNALRGVDFYIDSILPTFRISFAPLSNLREISIFWQMMEPSGLITQLRGLVSRSPDLQGLTFRGGIVEERVLGDQNDSIVRDIFAGCDENEKKIILRLQQLHLRLHRSHFSLDDFRSVLHHFQYLTFLQIRHEQPISSFSLGKVCGLLKDSGIWLKGIVVDVVNDPPLWDYLTAYSGLEYLILSSQQPSDNNALTVNRIFKELLPRHSASLTHLDFGWCSESGYDLWAAKPSNDQVKEVINCQKLKWLRVRWIKGEDTSIPCVIQWLETGIHLPLLEHLYMIPGYPTGTQQMRWATSRECDEQYDGVVENFKAKYRVRFETNRSSDSIGDCPFP